MSSFLPRATRPAGAHAEAFLTDWSGEDVITKRTRSKPASYPGRR
jgi:hypothetical protein